MDRQNYPLRVLNLHETTDATDLSAQTPTERLSIMWQLTLDAWAFRGTPLAESRLSRHITRLYRRTR
jgi:hypothetical protein